MSALLLKRGYMVEIEYNKIEENKEYETIIEQTIKTCFKEEKFIRKKC